METPTSVDEESALLEAMMEFLEGPESMDLPAVIYRYLDPKASTLDCSEVPEYTISMKEAISQGIVSEKWKKPSLLRALRVARADDFPHLTFYYYPCIAMVESSTKKQITLREYLSTSLGKGGQIVGFQFLMPRDFEHTQKGSIVGKDEKGTAFSSYQEFGGFTRSLFASITQRDGSNFDYVSDRELEFMEIPVGKFVEREPTIEEYDFGGRASVRIPNYKYVAPESLKGFDNPYSYQDGIIKYFRAGMAMPDANPAEINYVGDFGIAGYRIKIVSERNGRKRELKTGNTSTIALVIFNHLIDHGILPIDPYI